jgi:hypothetical protein
MKGGQGFSLFHRIAVFLCSMNADGQIDDTVLCLAAGSQRQGGHADAFRINVGDNTCSPASTSIRYSALANRSVSSTYRLSLPWLVTNCFMLSRALPEEMLSRMAFLAFFQGGCLFSQHQHPGAQLNTKLGDVFRTPLP